MSTKATYFTYPIKMRKQREGGYAITFVDFPEAITQGESKQDALLQAVDCLEEAVANRIALKQDLPYPSKPTTRQTTVTLHATIAAKAALYVTVRSKKVSNVQLARKLKCDEKEVRRLLDPYYVSKLPRIEHALEILGKRLQVGVI